MALQDLTPQLRTRLSRVERAVGIFVTVATLLLIAGFAYYVYHTAERKGWFKTKITYWTSLSNATGLKEGDAVIMMGFPVGEIMKVEPNGPNDYFNVTIYFRVKEPYYGYIWLDSKVRVAPADFLGNRSLEILKGRDGVPTVMEKGNVVESVLNWTAVDQLFKKTAATLERKIAEENPGFNEHAVRMEREMTITNEINAIIRKNPEQFYARREEVKPYWIYPQESPALTERLETLVNGLEVALPNILDLTNKISDVLTNVSSAGGSLNELLVDARPIVSNLTIITSNIRDPHGSLGEWILPTNLTSQLETSLKNVDEALKTADATMKQAGTTLANTDTNLTSLVSNLNASLENLANLTSNLNSQVQGNSNIISEVSSVIVHSDELVQGLKRHWLLRSAFKTNKTDKAKAPTTRR